MTLRMNNWIARRATVVFGTMWMFYAFFLYGLLPLIPPLKPYYNTFLYWSSWVQLWALPLLMVGQIVLGRAAEERAQQDHETLLAEFTTLKELHEAQAQEITELKATHLELAEMHQRIYALLQEMHPRQTRPDTSPTSTPSA